MVAHLVLDEGEEGVVEGLELLRLPDQCKALTICTAQRPPHVHCTHTHTQDARNTAALMKCSIRASAAGAVNRMF